MSLTTWWLGIGVTAATILGFRRYKRSRLPLWLQHALALGFERTNSTHVSATRYGERIVTIGYRPDRASGIGHEDESKLQIAIALPNVAGVQLDARTGVAADVEPGMRYVAPWVVTSGAPPQHARAILDAVGSTAQVTDGTQRLALHCTFGGGNSDVCLSVVISAATDRKVLDTAIQTAERLAGKLDRALRRIAVEQTSIARIPRVGPLR